VELGLAGKVAIVTGGSRGIGKAIALALAQEGVSVVVCARGIAGLQEAAAEIEATTGRSALALRTDVSQLDEIKELVAAVVRQLGGIDILVNNAVSSAPGTFLELPDQAWVDHITVKVIGYVRCIREVVPHMIRRGGGWIVNIGGMSAREVGSLRATNGVTTAAAANLTKNLADQLGPHRILINCIHPGATRTPRQTTVLERRARDLGIGLEAAERDAVRGIPIGRMIEPRDIANLALFLVSARASAITGQVVAVDGGAGRGVFY